MHFLSELDSISSEWNDIDRLIAARDLIRKVKGNIKFDTDIQATNALTCAVLAVEIAWKELE